MDDLARLVAERECERLMLTYARLVDSGHASGIADLFTEDGRWTSAEGHTLDGRNRILAAFQGREALTRRASRHVITNVVVDVESDVAASGIAYLINYRHDSHDGPVTLPAPARHPKFVGDYHLRFRREDQWRFESLRFELTFLRRAETPQPG